VSATRIRVPARHQRAPCVLLLVFLVAGTTLLPGSPAQPSELYGVGKAYVDPNGSVHVVDRGGNDRTISKEKDQVGSAFLKVADDKRTVGWSAEFENCCTSYPVPLVLVVYRDGKVQQRLGDGMMIYDWRFWAGGRQVAFCTGTVHGDSGGHCELHDAKTGRTLATIQGHLNDKSPAWAKGLQN
jgi:hypothetical protein